MKEIKFRSVFILCITFICNVKTSETQALNLDSTNIEGNAYSTDEMLEMIQIYHNNKYRDYLVDTYNMTLYMFSKDHIGTGYTRNDFNVSCITDQCLQDWIPVYIDPQNLVFKAGNGIKQSLIGTVKINDNISQLTYNNIPLYMYLGDQNPGDIYGYLKNSNGGIWYLISPQGRPIIN